MPLILFYRGRRRSRIPADSSVLPSLRGLPMISACTIALLVIWTVSTWAATYTIQFGDAAGGLVIEYDVTMKRYSESAFKNRVTGAMRNTTKLPIRCAALWPIIAGRSASSFGLVNVSIDAGASRPFSSREQIAGAEISAADITSWKGEACTTPLDYEFVKRSVTQNFSAGVVTGIIGNSQIVVRIENNSDQPIEIVWNDSSFIDRDGSEKRVFHSGVKYADREQSLPNMTIPPFTKVEDAVVPTANVSALDQRSGQPSGWRHHPLLPTEVRPESFEKAVTALNGAKLTLVLQLAVAAKRTPVMLVFEVSEVKSGTFKVPGPQPGQLKPEQRPNRERGE